MFQIFFVVFARLILKFCVRHWYQVSVTSEGRVDERGTVSMVITLVLRGKNSDPDSLLGKLLEVWRGRAWESTSGVSGSGKFDGGSSSGGGGLRMPVVGVSGILRKEQEMWESTDKSLQDAFQDLNALMVCLLAPCQINLVESLFLVEFELFRPLLETKYPIGRRFYDVICQS